MKYLLSLLLSFIVFKLDAQTTVQGIVVDAETTKPLPGISVFVSNTRIGTTTASDGSYRLQLPQGKYEVIFSAVNFITKVLPSDAADSFRTVRMQPKVKELEAVTIRAYDPDGWRNWGQFFINNFIGSTQFSDQCRITNPKVLRFYKDKKTGLLSVTATDVLVIENKSLGYILRYQLEEFTYDAKTKIIFYEGYPLFEEMQGNDRKMRKWKEHRLEAYEGSQLHFMRALYRNKLVEEGFELHRLQKQKNQEREKVVSLIRSGYRPADSAYYYDRILSQPEEIDVMYPAKLTGDSIAFAIDSFTAGLAFTDYLDILYTKSRAHSLYLQQYPKMPGKRISQVKLLDIDYIQVQADGSFYPSKALLSLGYWSWSEKISGMLPFDYKPG